MRVVFCLCCHPKKSMCLLPTDILSFCQQNKFLNFNQNLIFRDDEQKLVFHPITDCLMIWKISDDF